MKTHIAYLLIMGAMIAYFKMCVHPATLVSTVTSYVHVHDTVIHSVPKIKEVIKTVSKNKPVFVDTLAIIEDYNKKVVYEDMQQTRYGTVVIHDTVTLNRNAGRSIDFNLSVPTVTKTVQLPARNQVYIGPDIGFGIGGGLALKTKHDALFTLDYFFTQHGGLVMLGGKWKIKL